MIKHSKIIKDCTKIYNKKSIGYAGPEAAKIIREYFRVVKKTVLLGQEYKFPGKKGTMYIVKRKAKKTDNIQAATPQLGYDYDILIESNYLNRFDFDFKAAKSFRKELQKLIKKGKDYIYYGN